MKRNIFMLVVVYGLFWPGFISTNTHTFPHRHTRMHTI